MYLRRMWTSRCTTNCCDIVASVGVDSARKASPTTFCTSPAFSSRGGTERWPVLSGFNKRCVDDRKLICENNGRGIKTRLLSRSIDGGFNNLTMKLERRQFHCNSGHTLRSLFTFVPLIMRRNTMVYCHLEKVLERQGYCLYCTSAGKEDPDFVVLAKNVIEAAKKVNVMAGSVQEARVEALLKELHNQRLPLKQIQHILSQNLQLLQQPEMVIQLTELLQLHGLKQDVIVNILKILPLNDENVSFHSIQSLITNSLQNLRSLGFSEADLHSFLASEPKIVFVSFKTCSDVLSKLKGLFTKVDALSVIKNSPNVLSDPWIETNKKFDYAYFTMGYKQQAILKTHLFGHSLEHIQNRHLFLVRAGFFHPVKEKDDPRLNPNPPLSDVIDSADDFFVKRFGEMSEEEFKTFIAMREVEREEEIDESDETDDEEEERLNTKSTRKHTKK